jgi:hypothetical protein
MALGNDRHDARGGARGGSPELSLELALVAPSLQGLHLLVLQRMGVLTEVFTSVGEVWRGFAARKRTQGKLVRLRGRCGGPPALVLHSAMVAAPLPQHPVGRGRGTVKRDGDERMGCELFEMGKRSGGRGWVAGEVQFIGAQPGTDTRGGSGRLSSCAESMVR